MNEYITKAEEDILANGENFELLAQHRVTLSAVYSNLTEKLKQILIRKARGWMALRLKHKSNADAQSEWESSEDGIGEMVLKLDLKRVEKLMSSLKTLIDAQRTDYWNTPKSNQR